MMATIKVNAFYTSKVTKTNKKISRGREPGPPVLDPPLSILFRSVAYKALYDITFLYSLKN